MTKRKIGTDEPLAMLSVYPGGTYQADLYCPAGEAIERFAEAVADLEENADAVRAETRAAGYE